MDNLNFDTKWHLWVGKIMNPFLKALRQQNIMVHIRKISKNNLGNKRSHSHKNHVNRIQNIVEFPTYQGVHLCLWAAPPDLPLAVLDRVYVEVDGAVKGGEQVADAGDIGQPGWPGQLRGLQPGKVKFQIPA